MLEPEAVPYLYFTLFSLFRTLVLQSLPYLGLARVGKLGKLVTPQKMTPENRKNTRKSGKIGVPGGHQTLEEWTGVIPPEFKADLPWKSPPVFPKSSPKIAKIPENLEKLGFPGAIKLCRNGRA